MALVTGIPYTYSHISRVSQNCIYWVGQNRIYAPYMTVYLVISLPKIPYIHRIHMVLANPSLTSYKGPLHVNTMYQDRNCLLSENVKGPTIYRIVSLYMLTCCTQRGQLKMLTPSSVVCVAEPALCVSVCVCMCALQLSCCCVQKCVCVCLCGVSNDPRASTASVLFCGVSE